ncbi:DNA polymerase I, partial [Streptococcus suis]
AWGDSQHIYASDNLDLLTSPVFREALDQPIKTYDFKRSKVLLSHLGVELEELAFDSRLAKYLLSTVEDNTVATIARLYTDYALDTDEAVYGKGAKRAVPDKATLLSHLAKKVKVLQ